MILCIYLEFRKLVSGNNMFRIITLFGAILTLLISVLGSYARLSGVGSALSNQSLIDQLIAGSHVYLAAILGLLVVLLGLLSWQQKQCRLAALTTSLILLVLVCLQAALGFWAKAFNAMPIVVTTHVILGMTTFWLFFWLYLRVNPAINSLLKVTGQVRTGIVIFTRFAMFVLVLQIVLGVWVSANHAALACSGFPQCNGQWWPEADYQNALNLFSGLFTGYTGVIAFDAQVAANWLHRAGAMLCFVLLSMLTYSATATNSHKSVRTAGLWLSVLLFVQIGLAIFGLKLSMPLWAVLAHHVVAALLMLPLIAISFYSRYGWLETQLPVIKKEEEPGLEAIETGAVSASVEALIEAEVLLVAENTERADPGRFRSDQQRRRGEQILAGDREVQRQVVPDKAPAPVAVGLRLVEERQEIALRVPEVGGHVAEHRLVEFAEHVLQ